MKVKAKTKVITFKVTMDDYNKLREIAEEAHLSVSEVIRTLLVSPRAYKVLRNWNPDKTQERISTTF